MFCFGSDRRKGTAPRKGRVFGKPTLGLAALLVLAPAAWGQSFNVDLNIDDEPELGGGVPSDAFGGAANQPGRWNSVGTNGNAPWLVDLQGIMRPISVTTASSSGNFMGGGFRNLSNTGDYARLLNDAAHVNGAWRSWTLEGLTNGSYLVTTYATRTASVYSTALVTVSNSITPNPQITQGIMPGNQFVLGVTHVSHSALVLDNSLTITVSRNANDPNVHVNGFQLTAVPEPSTVVFVTSALLSFIARKRLRQ